MLLKKIPCGHSFYLQTKEKMTCQIVPANPNDPLLEPRYKDTPKGPLLYIAPYDGNKLWTDRGRWLANDTEVYLIKDGGIYSCWNCQRESYYVGGIPVCRYCKQKAKL